MYWSKMAAFLCVAHHKIANRYNNKYSTTTPLSHTELTNSMDELYNMEGASNEHWLPLACWGKLVMVSSRTASTHKLLASSFLLTIIFELLVTFIHSVSSLLHSFFSHPPLPMHILLSVTHYSASY